MRAKKGGKRKCMPKPKKSPMVELIMSKGLERIERVHVPEHHFKKRPKAPKPPPAGAGLVSRLDLRHIGPYPIEKSVANLAAHVYYLWGDTKHLTRKAVGSP